MATNDSVNVGLSGVTGSGNFVGSTSPTLITPALGTPASGNLVNCTGAVVAGGGTGVSSFTAYAVICGGTTSTGALQSVASVGTSGQVLTSNGAGALPTFQAAGGGNTGLINIQVFKTSGTYTPTSGMANCVIQCWGGGGAGGGNPASSSGSTGGGGGSGGYAQSYVSAATIGASQTVTVGTGGTGSSNANGGNGNDTSVGTIVIGKGGTGGTKSSGTSNGGAGGAAGVAGTGDITLPGNVGFNGSTSASGMGAGSFFGGSTQVVTSDAAGNSASANTGAGGSGSIGTSAGSSARAGGNGGSGLVIIYEYA